jgi:hypothetical protein
MEARQLPLDCRSCSELSEAALAAALANLLAGRTTAAREVRFDPVTKEDAMSGFEDVREHMEVIGADGVHVGTVDRIEGDRIKLTKAENLGSHQGHHHFISRGLVAEVEGDQVRLSANADVAVTFEEEEDGA